LFELGIPHGRLNISKIWARNNSKTVRTVVIYMEDIDNMEGYFRDLSKGGKFLATHESDYLEEFLDRANDRVTIIE